jgi:hypothetical protein
VDVIADQAGEKYNVVKSDTLSDFKIVAFKGTPRYEAFSARLNTDITGGFSGIKKMVSPSVLASTTAVLEERLTARLVAEIRASVPREEVLFEGAWVPVFGRATVENGGEGEAVVSVKGTLYGVALKRDDLINRIAGEKVASTFGSFSYTTPGLEDLEFVISNPKDFSPADKNSLIFRLNGDMKLVGSVPVDELKGKLAGAMLAETGEILRPYSLIIDPGSSGEVTPPWARVPEDTERIFIVIKD